MKNVNAPSEKIQLVRRFQYITKQWLLVHDNFLWKKNCVSLGMVLKIAAICKDHNPKFMCGFVLLGLSRLVNDCWGTNGCKFKDIPCRRRIVFHLEFLEDGRYMQKNRVLSLPVDSIYWVSGSLQMTVEEQMAANSRIFIVEEELPFTWNCLEDGSNMQNRILNLCLDSFYWVSVSL